MAGSGTNYINRIIFDDGSETNSVKGLPKVAEYEITYNMLSDTGLTTYIDIPVDYNEILSIEIRPKIVFVGTGITELVSFLGDDNNAYSISSEHNLLAAVAPGNYQRTVSINLDSTTLRLTVEAVGANLDQLTSGSFDLIIKYIEEI